jgi:hypothetical protein
MFTMGTVSISYQKLNSNVFQTNHDQLKYKSHEIYKFNIYNHWTT